MLIAYSNIWIRDKREQKGHYGGGIYSTFLNCSFMPKIVGEIKAARDALVEVTSRLRSYLYREFFPKDMPPPSISAPGSLEASSPNNITPAREGHTASDPPTTNYQNVQAIASVQPSKVILIGRAENAMVLLSIRFSLSLCSFLSWIYVFFFFLNGY